MLSRRMLVATLLAAVAVLALGATTPGWARMPVPIPDLVAGGAAAAAIAVAGRPWSPG